MLSQQNFAQQIEAHRQHYKDEFLKNEHSPLKKGDIAFLRFYDADSTFRVAATFEKTPLSEPFMMPTSSGRQTDYVKYGVATFILHGQTVTLSIYRNLGLSKTPEYKDYVFLPFKDQTAGKDTYGGGRYLDFRFKDFENGKVIIDFNKAYNPYCAYSDGYSCPIPPKENHLPVAIAAGEKVFGKEH